MNSKTKFCIHGASSLIGKNFCRYLLSKKTDFVVFARRTSNLSFLENCKKVKIYRYDTHISELIGKVPSLKDSVFIELAWNGVFGTEKDKSDQIAFNIPQVINSIELAKSIDVKHWIGFGSMAEYGNIQSKKSVSERFECNPVTLYGKSKLMCSEISKNLCAVYGIECTWLRLFSAYGPYGNHNWFIDYLIGEMKLNKVLNVTKSEQYLDYLYVDDISNLFVKLASSKGVGIVNLGSGKAVQLKEIIEKIKFILKSKSVVNYGAVEYKKDQGMFNEADITKLTKLTGWRPKINLDKGLRDMIKKNNYGN